MIVLSGSVLVKDSEGMHDLDIVYLTFNIGKYVLLLKLKASIEDALRKKLGIKATFSPYLISSPTVVGNLFLAITLLRYPYRKKYVDHLLKLALARHDKRWLTLHLAFAILGIISSENARDYRKYCSMLAENLLYRHGIKIPNTWGQTIRLGYALSLRLGLQYTSLLLRSCLKHAHNRDIFRKTGEELLKRVVQEYLSKVIGKDIIAVESSINDIPRHIHEVIMSALFAKKIKWVKCSSTLLTLITPRILSKILTSSSIRALAIALFNECRYEIPILSPLLHP